MLLEVSLMNIILRISNEMKWMVQVVVTRCTTDELLSSFLQGQQMEHETDVTRSIIDELHSLDIQGDQVEGERGVTPSIIDELRSWDNQGGQMEVKVLLLEVSLMNFILRISKESNGR